MKPKVLSYEECECGNGWQAEDCNAIECPKCYNGIEIPANRNTVTCEECGTKILIKRGILKMVKLEEK